MRRALGLALLCASCAGNGVLAREQRAAVVAAEAVEWHPASAADVPGVYVSSELTGALAGYLRKLVYLFEADGSYAGAALVDVSPPRFEVLAGSWAWVDGSLVLDGGPPATLEVAASGGLRLSGAEGVVVLQRERAR
jgi:hypothetical protein